MKRRRYVRSLAVLLGVAVVMFFAFTWLAASRLICPERRPLQDYHREILDHAKEHGLRIESFTVKSSDGYDTPCLMCEPLQTPGAALKGNKLRAELQVAGLSLAPWGEVKATLVLLHGHGGRKEDYLPVAERFCAAGFRCLMPDLPGHGDNPAPFATFGYHEVTLPGEVLREAARRYEFAPQPAGLFGISQGGAIVLQTAAQEDQTWFAVAELSSFASLKELIDEEAAHYFGPVQWPARAVMRQLVSWRAGFDLDEVRPVAAAARLTMPTLIGHGDADTFVAPKNAQMLWEALPGDRKEFLNVPGATHGTVLATATPVYAIVTKFFWEGLPRKVETLGVR